MRRTGPAAKVGPPPCMLAIVPCWLTQPLPFQAVTCRGGICQHGAGTAQDDPITYGELFHDEPPWRAGPVRTRGGAAPCTCPRSALASFQHDRGTWSSNRRSALSAWRRSCCLQTLTSCLSVGYGCCLLARCSGICCPPQTSTSCSWAATATRRLLLQQLTSAGALPVRACMRAFATNLSSLVQDAARER